MIRRGEVNQDLEDPPQTSAFFNRLVPRRAPDQNLRGGGIGDRLYGWIFRKAIMEVVDSSGFFRPQSAKSGPRAGLFITYRYYLFFIAPKVGKMLKAFKLFYIICLIPESFHIFPTGFCGRINVEGAQSSAILLQSCNQ